VAGRPAAGDLLDPARLWGGRASAALDHRRRWLRGVARPAPGGPGRIPRRKRPPEEDFSERWSRAREDFERKLFRKRDKVKVRFVELDYTIPVQGPETEVIGDQVCADFLALAAVTRPGPARIAATGGTRVATRGSLPPHRHRHPRRRDRRAAARRPHRMGPVACGHGHCATPAAPAIMVIWRCWTPPTGICVGSPRRSSRRSASPAAPLQARCSRRWRFCAGSTPPAPARSPTARRPRSCPPAGAATSDTAAAGGDATGYRHYWELTVLLALRDGLRSGDVFVPGSRRYATTSSEAIGTGGSTPGLGLLIDASSALNRAVNSTPLDLRSGNSPSPTCDCDLAWSPELLSWRAIPCRISALPARSSAEYEEGVMGTDDKIDIRTGSTVRPPSATPKSGSARSADGSCAP